jgi:hypothetical protein
MCGAGAGAAIPGRAIPDIIPLPCAEAIAGITAKEAKAIKKRRMVSTWVPGPPGLSCTYIDKDAPNGGWVSSDKNGTRSEGNGERGVMCDTARKSGDCGT